MLKSKIEQGTAISAFAYALDKNESLANFDSAALKDAIPNIKDGMDKGINAEQVAQYFEENKSFEGIVEHQNNNNTPQIDGIASEEIGCLQANFTAVNPMDADGDKTTICWNFGDKPSEECYDADKVVNHKFATNKSVVVRATIRDSISSSYKEITYQPDTTQCAGEVDVDFSYKVINSATGTVKFNASVEGDVDHYEWNFGDNVTNNSTFNPEHTYSLEAGQVKTFTVTLTVYDQYNKPHVKSIELTLSLDKNNPPIGSAAIQKVSDNKISYTSDYKDPENKELSFKWDFGDGIGQSQSPSGIYEYTKAGSFKVTLEVSDGVNIITKDVGTANPCGENCGTPVVTYKTTAAVVAKNELTVTLTGSSEASDGDSNFEYSWDMGDGKTTQVGQEVTYSYDKAGTYTAVLFVKKEGKVVDSKEVKVTVTQTYVNQPPVVDGTATLNGAVLTYTNKSTDADNDPLTCVWDFGDGKSSTACNGTHSYTAAGTYSVKLTVSDGKNDKVSKEIAKVVYKPVIENNAPVVSGTATLVKNTLTFNSTSTDADGDALTYKWDFGDGSNGATTKSGTYTYTKQGTYKVTLTVSDGKDTVQKVINENVTPCGDSCSVGPNNAPTADFHYAITGLEGKLTAVATDADNDKLSYSWSADGATFSNAKGKTTNVAFASGGSKTITLNVSDGKDTASKTYTISLKTPDVVKPTKKGIYYKGDANKIYIWDKNQTKYAGEWPGSNMESASVAGWSFYDTSSISVDSINVIFLKDGNKLTGDLDNSPVQGCYVSGSWVAFDKCQLNDADLETVEGGCDIPQGDDNVLLNDIPWNQLDYASFTSEANVSVDSAPYVQTNLAPGSYKESQTVTLSLVDAERNVTGGKIYYTLDNTVPTESSTEYTGPITLEDTSDDGLGTAYRLRTLVIGDNGLKQEQHFFWFIKTNDLPKTNVDFRDETIYFVVTARYYDGDESNNYYCRDRFDAEDPSWRGDFKGLIEKLDYIKDLGFTAIWLTPPVENRSGLDYHGYHAYDWFQTDLRLESPGATYFDFIKAAHKKGIKVIQDVVLNHSSNYGIRGQVYIEKIPTKYYVEQGKAKGWVDMGPYQGHIGDYLSYGKCDNDNPVAPVWHRAVCAGDPNGDAQFTVKFKQGTASVTGGETPKGDARYYWSPAVDSYLPEKWYHEAYTNNWESVEEVQLRSMAGDCVDLKTENDNVRNYMNAAMSMYIDMGIDAVRIDTLKHMPREDVISMVSTWKKKKPDLFVYGEALIKGFGDNTPYNLLPWYYTRTGSGNAKEGDSGISVLDFSLMSTFRDNVTKGSVSQLGSVFERFDGDYADATKLVTFFQNHDLTPDNTWSGAGAQHCCSDRANSALAYNVLWTVRGIPVMYAGDETGARVGLPPDLTSSNDLVKDTGRIYIGDTLQMGTDPIQAHIKDLNAVRKTSKALQRGKLKVLAHEPLVFERQYENERAIVAIPGTGGGSVTVSGATDGTYTDVITGAKFTVSGGSVSLGNIPGSSMRVLVKDYTGSKVSISGKFLK